MQTLCQLHHTNRKAVVSQVLVHVACVALLQVVVQVSISVIKANAKSAVRENTKIQITIQKLLAKYVRQDSTMTK